MAEGRPIENLNNNAALEESRETGLRPEDVTLSLSTRPVNSPEQETQTRPNSGLHQDTWTKNKGALSLKVDFTNKKKSIGIILKYMCAFLNTLTPSHKHGRSHWTLQLQNEVKKFATKDYDIWVQTLEEHIKTILSCFGKPSEYYRLTGDKDNIVLKIWPVKELISINVHHYYSMAGSKEKCNYRQVIQTMLQEGKPGQLPKVPEGPYMHGQCHEDLKNESDCIQFKELTCKQENLEKTIWDYTYPYVSAFAGLDGGMIFFGIADNGVVKGMELDQQIKIEIDNMLTRKINNLIWGDSEPGEVQKGIHWDSQFINIYESNRFILAISVCKFPGGVYTELPESYLVTSIENNEIQIEQIKPMNEWMRLMRERYYDGPSKKKDIAELMDHVDDKTMELKDHFDKKMSLMENKIKSADDTHNQKWNPQADVTISNIYDGEVKSYLECTQSYMELERKMKNKDIHTFILRGLCGTGKTMLALKYAIDFKSENENSITWRLNCKDEECLMYDMWDFVSALTDKNPDLNPYLNSPCKIYGDCIARELCQRYKATQIPVLMILDEVKDTSCKIVQQFKKDLKEKCPDAKVIVTTTLQLLPTSKEETIVVTGFSESEAHEFLKSVPNADRQEPSLEKLIKSFSFNPLGLNIAKHYMISTDTSADKLLYEIQQSPKYLDDMENCGHEEDKHLFESLLSIFKLIEEKNKKVFSMLFVLQYLEAEKIPLILFEDMFEEGSTQLNKFIMEIKKYSFGRIDRADDDRLLTTHDVIILALKLYMQKTMKQSDQKEFKQNYLKILLQRFMMLMHKDNRCHADLERHRLLVPHAIAVMGHVESMLENSFVHLRLSMVYVYNIIGYTISFNHMYAQSVKYYKKSMDVLFSLIGLDKTQFDAKIAKNGKDSEILKATSDEVFKCIEGGVEKNKEAITSLCRQFLLKRLHSEDDLKRLNIENRLDYNEETYEALCRNGQALPEDQMGRIFLFELAVFVLYTYGRSIFYLSDDEVQSQLPLYGAYLFIAQFLCDRIESESTITILLKMLTKRDGAIRLLDLIGVDGSYFKTEDIHDFIKTCKAHIEADESKNSYFEFGILKVQEGDDHNKAQWLKLILKCYKKLFELTNDHKAPREMMEDVRRYVKTLEELMITMSHKTSYSSFQISIFEGYMLLGEYKMAKQYLEDALSKQSVVQPDHGTIILKKSTQNALKTYIIKLIDVKSKEGEMIAQKYQHFLTDRSALETIGMYLNLCNCDFITE